jgi:predicted ATPase/class 3 adenylate cyclase
MQPHSFGYWLKRRRKALDLTQAELASQVGCSAAAIRKLEAEERRPSAQIVERLAEIFDIHQEERAAFLRFARGDWRAAPTGVETAPWLFPNVRERDGQSKSKIVTFLFTDIEGSTKLSQQYPDSMPGLLARHHEILNQAIQAQNGHVFQIIGDAFCAAFHSPTDALNAALEAQRNLQNEQWSPAPIKVRMGIHTGVAQLSSNPAQNPYSGHTTLALTQRIMSAGHGGQILLTNATEVLLRGQLPKDVNLRDMGEHNFKDVFQPVRVFQVSVLDLQTEFPPLRALDVFPNNLPLQLTSFIGRKKEIRQIKKLLEQYRLVTLTGSGGIGKTRLSIQVASELLNNYPDGTWLVELAPVTDPTLVPQAIVTTLGLIDQAGRPPLTVLTDYLQDKQALLILDNCEHLIQACAQLAEALLHACPDLHILATSREALEISGESLYHVPSLITPEPLNIAFDILPQYEAVQLFVERAQSAMHDFSLAQDNARAIAQVCHHLDGIPLALELAAARVKVLRVEEIAVRLDDRFHLLTGGARTAMPRHQTLRAMIDWSHDLLTEPERVLLRRLSVFAGGWSLEAAEAICADNLTPDPVSDRPDRRGESAPPSLIGTRFGRAGGLGPMEVLDLLSQLANKSLVIAERAPGAEARYRLLETIRQYARDRLAESGEAERTYEHHLAYFLQLAERAEPELRGAKSIIWLERLEVEHANLRAALEWSLENASCVEAGLRLAGALGWFWHLRNYYSEGREWLAQAVAAEVAAPGPTERPRLAARAKALHWAGWLAYTQSDPEPATALSEASLALARAAGDRQSMGYALCTLGVLACHQGNYERSAQLMMASLDLFRELDHKPGLLHIAAGLAEIPLAQKDYAQAVALYRQFLALARELGDEDGTAWALVNLGHSTLHQGDYDDAGALLSEGLTLLHEAGNKAVSAWALFGLGLVALHRGQYEQATAQLKESLIQASEMGYKAGIVDCLHGLAHVAAAEGSQEGTLRGKKLARAARLFGAAEAEFEAMSARFFFAVDRAEGDRQVTAIRAQLDEATFAAAWEEGRGMTMEQAIEYALELSTSP